MDVAPSPPSPVRGQVVLLGLRSSHPALAPQIAGFVCIRFSFSVRTLLFWPRGVRGGVHLLRRLRNKRPTLFEAQLETTAQKNLCVLCPNPRPPLPPPYNVGVEHVLGPLALRNKRPVWFGAPPALPAPLLIHAGRRPVCAPTLYGGGRGGAAFRETADRRVGRLFRKHRTLKKPRFRFGFLSRLRPYWCFRAFLLRAFSSFFCQDVYLICADATPKVRILGHRGRPRGGLGVAKAKDRSSLPVSLKKRKKETAWPHRRSIAHKAQ